MSESYRDRNNYRDPLERERRRKMEKARRNRQIRRHLLMLVLAVVFAGIFLFMSCRFLYARRISAINMTDNDTDAASSDSDHEVDDQPENRNPVIEAMRPELDVELLDINSYSRPGIALTQVNGIVIHYTANPGASAIANRDYFENLSVTHETKASSHFIVGLEGEIVQCIPCNEIAYASNNRNSDTIAIECCIEDETGEFNEKTYASVIELTGWLMLRYGLTSDDVIRHYDVTGKNCPKYFVEHPQAWEQFRADLDTWIADHPVE